MNDFKNPFVLDANQYSRDLNIIKHYVEQVATFLSKKQNISIEKATEFVKNNLKKGGKFEFKDRNIEYFERLNTGDKNKKNGTLYEYIKQSISNKELIAPTFTTYINSDTKESVLAKFTEENISKRSKAKKEMFVYASNKNTVMEEFKSHEQNALKIYNNSLSGAFGSKFTPLYNKSAHSTLTSTTRSTSAYGNANNEKFLCGNRHYFNYDIVINNIVSIISNTDYVKYSNIINKYKIHVPTVDEVMECITYSSKLYWDETLYINKIKELVISLNDLERCAFVYTGDFFHLKKHNESLVKELLIELSKKCTGNIDNPLEVIKNTREDHLNLAHQICYKETKGIGKNHIKIENTDDLNTLALTCLNIKNIIIKYSDLFDTLWITKNIPASVAHFPSSIRRAAIVSDTDSTIFTVQDWVHWITNDYSFNEKTLAVGATVVFLVNSVLEHILAIMSANFGINKKNLFRIAMKNEYTFPVFIPTNNSKHYYASISCREGNVFEENDMEIKGVHLKNSNAPKIIASDIKTIIKEILDDVEKRVSINSLKYLNKIANIEREIINNVKSGKVDFYRSSRVNDLNSYAKEAEQSPYFRHIFWNNIFGDKYGKVGEPPYTTYKINLNIKSKKVFKEWLDVIPDDNIKSKMLKWFETYNKELKTFYIPSEIVSSKGVPIEILPIVDYRKIVKDCCKSFYIILETLGIFIVGSHDRIISDFY